MGGPWWLKPETSASGGTYRKATCDDYNYQYQWTKTWQGQGNPQVDSSASNHVTGLENGSGSGWWTHAVGDGIGTSCGTSWGSPWSQPYDETVTYPGFYEGAYYGNVYWGNNADEYIDYLGDAFSEYSGSDGSSILPSGQGFFCVPPERVTGETGGPIAEVLIPFKDFGRKVLDQIPQEVYDELNALEDYLNTGQGAAPYREDRPGFAPAVPPEAPDTSTKALRDALKKLLLGFGEERLKYHLRRIQEGATPGAASRPPGAPGPRVDLFAGLMRSVRDLLQKGGFELARLLDRDVAAKMQAFLDKIDEAVDQCWDANIGKHVVKGEDKLRRAVKRFIGVLLRGGDATLGEVVRGVKELLDALKGSLGEKWKVKITPHLSQDGINITIELVPP